MTLRPGGQVTLAAGVRVRAPSHWRPEHVHFVRVQVQLMAPLMLPVPLPSGATLATGVYRVEADRAVQTVDAARFVIAVPVKGQGKLVPLRLDIPTVDLAPGARTSAHAGANWTTDTLAHPQEQRVEFASTTLSGDAQSFTVVRVND